MFSKKVITAILITLAVFTVAVLIVFCVVGEEPATLIGCVFAFCGAEGGCLALIKVTKEKTRTETEEKEFEEDTEE